MQTCSIVQPWLEDRTGRADVLAELLPDQLSRPLVTVHDGHPHTLAFLGGVRGDRTRSLGVTTFGQSSSLSDAYRLHGIDADSVVTAALSLLAEAA